MADASETRSFVGAFIMSLGDKFPAHGFGSFCYDDNAETSTALFTPLNTLTNLADAVGNLRDEDDVASAGHARVQRDPAGIASHHFTEEHAMMGFCRRVQAVDGIGGHRKGRIKTKRHIRSAQIIVDGLGYADDVHAEPLKFEGAPKCAVAAHGDEAVDLMFFNGVQHVPGSIARFHLRGL